MDISYQVNIGKIRYRATTAVMISPLSHECTGVFIYKHKHNSKRQSTNDDTVNFIWNDKVVSFYVITITQYVIWITTDTQKMIKNIYAEKTCFTLTPRGRVTHICIRNLDQNLTHWGRDEMNNISQTTFSNLFSSMKMFEFRLKFHWSLFPRVQLTKFRHWFR